MLWAGQKAVLLKDGSLGVLHDEWMQQYSAIIKHGKINKDEIEVARVMAISEQQVSSERQVLIVNKGTVVAKMAAMGRMEVSRFTSSPF